MTTLAIPRPTSLFAEQDYSSRVFQRREPCPRYKLYLHKPRHLDISYVFENFSRCRHGRFHVRFEASNVGCSNGQCWFPDLVDSPARHHHRTTTLDVTKVLQLISLVSGDR